MYINYRYLNNEYNIVSPMFFPCSIKHHFSPWAAASLRCCLCASRDLPGRWGVSCDVTWRHHVNQTSVSCGFLSLSLFGLSFIFWGLSDWQRAKPDDFTLLLYSQYCTDWILLFGIFIKPIFIVYVLLVL